MKLFQSMQVSTWLSDIAFYLSLIWLQTLVVINSEFRQIVSKLLLISIYYCNLSRQYRLPFLGQIINLDVLLCSGFNLEHEDLFLCPNFLLRDQ